MFKSKTAIWFINFKLIMDNSVFKRKIQESIDLSFYRYFWQINKPCSEIIIFNDKKHLELIFYLKGQWTSNSSFKGSESLWLVIRTSWNLQLSKSPHCGWWTLQLNHTRNNASPIQYWNHWEGSQWLRWSQKDSGKRIK